MSKKFDKLVRDKIPKIIKQKGKSCKFRIADRDEYRVKLAEKLLEETIEFIAEPSIEELADIQEVIDALITEHKWTGLKAATQYKKIIRGGFQERIILEEVSG
tara:strand:- start:12 stop:320 length:309 start_codon:yes stop_codon:yes gene_type:complete